MKQYIVFYKTKSGKSTREIPFKHYEAAQSLFNTLNRDRH